MLTAFFLLSTALAAPTDDTGPEQSSTTELRPAPSQRSPNLALGMHGGRWGKDYGSGFRVEAPLFKYGGVRMQQITQYANTNPAGEPGYMPTMGGTAQLFLRTPVIQDTWRFRMGGGPLVAIDGRHELALGGAGFAGVEILAMDRTTFTFEVGGAGGSGAIDQAEGVSVMGGVSFYLGKL